MSMGFDGGFQNFDTGFQAFNVIFSIVFLIIIGSFIVTFAKAIGQWNKNNQSPRLEVYAKIVGKREDVTWNRTDNQMAHSRTDYYVTFEVVSGDRMEFEISGKEYGQMAEGDDGKLSFQGTRFLGFEHRSQSDLCS